MKIWYRAVCDEHKEYMDLFVSNPIVTSSYLGEHSEAMQGWLEKHAQCNLRLIHRDEELDEIHDKKYTKVTFETIYKEEKLEWEYEDREDDREYYGLTFQDKFVTVYPACPGKWGMQGYKIGTGYTKETLHPSESAAKAAGEKWLKELANE